MPRGSTRSTSDARTPTPHRLAIPTKIGQEFTDTWCGNLTADIAARLNCDEVETLTALLRALGAEQAADEWTAAHAAADEPSDRHYQGPADPLATSPDAFRWRPLPEQD